MIKKLVSHGNSAALIIDKPILDLLKVDMETPFEISADGKNLIILPACAMREVKLAKKVLDKVNKIFTARR